jgi:hypothetical protein
MDASADDCATASEPVEELAPIIKTLVAVITESKNRVTAASMRE